MKRKLTIDLSDEKWEIFLNFQEALKDFGIEVKMISSGSSSFGVEISNKVDDES